MAVPEGSLLFRLDLPPEFFGKREGLRPPTRNLDCSGYCRVSAPSGRKTENRARLPHTAEVMPYKEDLGQCQTLELYIEIQVPYHVTGAGKCSP
jgi:hypothetical protein